MSQQEKPRYRIQCWDCGGSGFSHHDCGEDTCCCLYPEDNVACDTCDGEGHWDSSKPPIDPDVEYWEIEEP